MAFNQRPSTSGVSRTSSRKQQQEIYKTLDTSVLTQRKNKQLESLEQDNAHDDPFANVVRNKLVPRFDVDGLDSSFDGRGKKRRSEGEKQLDKPKRKRLARPEFNKTRFRKTFAAHVADQSRAIELTSNPDARRVNAYERAQAPPPTQPTRKFCAVCGFFSKYTCIKCTARYCSISCRDVHNDTRCMRWTA